MARQLGDWLTSYLQYVDNTEPPLSYHTWVGLSVIAAALQRRCYLRWGHETLYPNLYVVLVGASGKCRKGTAMTLGKDLLTSAGIKLVSESITQQALIRALRKSVNSYTDPDTGRIVMHCSLMCMSEELHVFLGEHDTKFLSTLTDWYDSRDIWRYETKNMGFDVIEGVCFNLLGATAPDWFASILPQVAIGGGFTSRIIFIVEENKRKVVELHTLTEQELALRQKLIHDLEILATLAGEFKMSKEAEAAYIHWYRDQEARAQRGEYAVSDPRFMGYNERRATHLRKLSMIFSASRSNARVVTKTDLERALAALVYIEQKMPLVFGGLGQARYAGITQKVLDYIKRRKKVRRSDLMSLFYLDVDAQTLEVIEKVLTYMKVIRIERMVTDGEIVYTYTGARE